MGLGVIMVPDVLSQMPKLVQAIFSSAITTGGLAAIIMSTLLPEDKTAMAEAEDGAKIEAEAAVS
jgi:xanthine permease XanP